MKTALPPKLATFEAIIKELRSESQQHTEARRKADRHVTRCYMLTHLAVLALIAENRSKTRKHACKIIADMLSKPQHTINVWHHLGQWMAQHGIPDTSVAQSIRLATSNYERLPKSVQLKVIEAVRLGQSSRQIKNLIGPALGIFAEARIKEVERSGLSSERLRQEALVLKTLAEKYAKAAVSVWIWDEDHGREILHM